MNRNAARALAAGAVAVGLLGIAVVLVDRSTPLPPAGARVTVDGRATVVHADGASESLASGDIVRSGEEVRVEAGSVSLELAAGGVLEGRAGNGDDVEPTRVVVAARPQLVAGDLLVLGDPGLAVDAAGTVVAVGGDSSAVKVSRGLAVTTAAYRGGAEVESAGQSRSVPALRSLGVATLGRPAGSPSPIELAGTDSWDRRFLGQFIDLGDQLDALSEGFTFTVSASAATNAALYRTALPALARESSLPALLRDGADHTAGELLVGAVLASMASAGSFEERWADVFAFREAGASWGVVAADQGLSPADVLSTVRSALGADDPATVALPPAPSPTTQPSPGATTPTTSSVAGGGATSTTPTTAPTPTTSPSPTTPTSPTPTTPTLPPVTLPPTDIPLPTLPPPEPSPSDVPDLGVPIVDDTLEAVEDLVTGLLG